MNIADDRDDDGRRRWMEDATRTIQSVLRYGR